MSFQATGPGKTAPKLCQDFLAFDPVRGKPNILTEHPAPVGDGPQLASLIGSCEHDYTTKLVQSVTPPLDLRPDGTTQYKLAIVCRKCRIHADIFVDYTNSTLPCPTSDRPLHHFQRVPAFDQIRTERIKYVWECSASECHAHLWIAFRLPRISDKEKELLTDPILLKSRYEALVQDDPERDGIRPATGMDSLFRLRRYIKDSLDLQHSRKQLPANNKRFQEAFGINGQDCHELLERLGFKYAEATWLLPHPPDIADRLRVDDHNHRELLEDVVFELLAWMYKIASEQRLVNLDSKEVWSSANRDVERTLAAQGYQHHVPFRRAAVVNEERPYFYSLGALPDFSDSLIEYCYDRQTVCDPAQQAYYLECLQVISESRQTEQLQVKVATLQSTDLVSRRDLRAAYRYLNIPYSDANSLTEGRIIEIFQAQQSDLGPAAQEDARASLLKIGLSRGSSRLINASRQSVDTYEDALNWLGNGVTKDTPDEGLLVVVAIKTADSPANEEIAQKAISVIAKARQSNMLNNWLLTGRNEGYTMSVDEALRHLNIDQKLESIDHVILPAIFESARQDRPGEMTNKAIATIEQAMAGTMNGVARSPATWPVGLTSHGNTCYLNSLLQYYFSIKPLRDIILDYDKYKLDTSAHTEKAERVGQRKISMVEIKGGQRFAEDLRHLFEQMIKSPDSAVKPEEDLVCRAFLEPKDYALLASSIRGEKMYDAGEEPTMNDLTSAIDEKLMDVDAFASSPATLTDGREQCNGSGITLQTSASGDDSDVPMQNGKTPVTPPASPGLKGQELKPAPEHAPPLPPRRRFSTTKEEALSRAQTNARLQQDVTEVHDGIMFRLRSGMMPRDRDASEEQEDELRDLFSLCNVETTINKGVTQTPKELTDTSIQLNVPTEPTDIYSALDAVYDLQAYTENVETETFKTVKKLPPLLQINIPRIDFDKASGAAYKSDHCVRLTDELYLDRYCDYSDPSILRKRKECWYWRRRLHSLRRELKVLSQTALDLDGPTAIAETANFLTSLDDVNKDLQSIGVEPIEADGEITSRLREDALEQAQRSSALEFEIRELERNLDAQFADMDRLKYHLAAVFFHRGGHGHGHYWIYIHDFANNIWRSYNDERVEEFSKMEDIFEARTWQQGTPTYAVYVAADQIDFIEAVCRAPEKPPSPKPTAAPETKDVWMEDNPGYQMHAPEVIDPKLVAMGGGQPEWEDVGMKQVPEDAGW